MAMQTDVLSAMATATGTLVATARTRVKSIVVTHPVGAGLLTLRDGGASGTIKIQITTPAAIGLEPILLPGEGVLFYTDVHATLTSVTAVTIFYG